MNPIDPPFQYFGGKRLIADEVWKRLGQCDCYIEPFFGSGAVLLARPNPSGVEIVNDIDAYLCNFWRATQQFPDEVADMIDWPVNENDLEARHRWLIDSERRRELKEKVTSDPMFCDSKIAAWWVWGMSIWFGAGWCEKSAINGHRTYLQKIPHLTGRMGVNRRLGDTIEEHRKNAKDWMRTIQERLRWVMVTSGDFIRPLSNATISAYNKNGKRMAVFFDPPYATEGRAMCYSNDSTTVAVRARDWALKFGNDIKIALCGYHDEHVNDLPGWKMLEWKASGGFAKPGKRGNRHKERIWFSPACDDPANAMLLFDALHE